ncbi:Uu.00g115570.m01.CDS01 [Anthostomella pinea]|uniref:Uu.00g115570.m01.CDS01 n=1 Tax=Anthostomella pinea TaxID=933095 RepID=A0AAI8VFS5_9PEZI|nr:Uu.00g115570.m01.CDS01 [Anthostomella pinea]
MPKLRSSGCGGGSGGRKQRGGVGRQDDESSYDGSKREDRAPSVEGDSSSTHHHQSHSHSHRKSKNPHKQQRGPAGPLPVPRHPPITFGTYNGAKHDVLGGPSGAAQWAMVPYESNKEMAYSACDELIPFGGPFGGSLSPPPGSDQPYSKAFSSFRIAYRYEYEKKLPEGAMADKEMTEQLKRLQEKKKRMGRRD